MISAPNPDPNVHAGYNAAGSFTRVDPSAASAMRPLTARDQLTALMDQEQQHRQAPQGRVSNRLRGPKQRTTRAGRQRITRNERQVAPRGPSWQSLQGAATVPVGLGAQMIPGMQVDQSKLPPSMRASQSSFSGPMGTISSAGEDVRMGQAQDQQLEAGRLDLGRQRSLLQALADREFEAGGVGRSY